MSALIKMLVSIYSYQAVLLRPECARRPSGVSFVCWFWLGRPRVEAGILYFLWIPRGCWHLESVGQTQNGFSSGQDDKPAQLLDPHPYSQWPPPMEPEKYRRKLWGALELAGAAFISGSVSGGGHRSASLWGQNRKINRNPVADSPCLTTCLLGTQTSAPHLTGCTECRHLSQMSSENQGRPADLQKSFPYHFFKLQGWSIPMESWCIWNMAAHENHP